MRMPSASPICDSGAVFHGQSLLFGFALLLMPSDKSWPCKSQMSSTFLNGLAPEHLISFCCFREWKNLPSFSFYFPSFNQFANHYAAFTDTHQVSVLCPWTDKGEHRTHADLS